MKTARGLIEAGNRLRNRKAWLLKTAALRSSRNFSPMVFIRSYLALLTSSGILRMLSLIACSFVPYRTPDDVNRAKLSHPWYDTKGFC